MSSRVCIQIQPDKIPNYLFTSNLLTTTTTTKMFRSNNQLTSTKYFLLLYSRWWIGWKSTQWFGGRIGSRLQILEWFQFEFAFKYRPTFVFADAGWCNWFWACGELFETIFWRRAFELSVLKQFFVFVVFYLQGDLDRQRLLGDRPRANLYENIIEEGIEGIEHQER